MSAFKKVLLIGGIVIVLLITIPLIAALFVKKDYAVERDIIINRPAGEVFEYIKYLKNQDNYSVWATLDPDMKQEFRGTDGTVGFVSAWEGNEDVGKGEQTIVNIIEGERVECEIYFIEPWEARADASMSTEALFEDQTRVTWAFSSRAPYPFNLMFLFMNPDDMIGSDLGTGLENLKSILEGESDK